MLGKSHILASESIFLCGAYNMGMHPNEFFYPLLGGILIGSILPDVDTPNSLINKIIFLLGRNSMEPMFKFKHRGFTHTIYAWLITLIIAIIGLFINMFLGLFLGGISLGYLLHLIEDSFSVAGISWLGKNYDQYVLNKYGTLMRTPVRYVNKKPIRHWWGRGYEVGSRTETIIVIALLMLGTYCTCLML